MHVGGDYQLKWPERARSAEVQIDLTNPGANHRANDTRALTTGKVTWEATLCTYQSCHKTRSRSDGRKSLHLPAFGRENGRLLQNDHQTEPRDRHGRSTLRSPGGNCPSVST